MNKNYLFVCLISLSIISVSSIHTGYAKDTPSTQKVTSNDPYLETKSFKIYIKDPCPLYETVCGNVIYTAISKQNPKNKITLKGTTLNDGSQYTFQGYIFKNGNYTYSLTPKSDKDLNRWSLKVTQTDKDGNEHILSQGDGEWKYDEQQYWETDTYKIVLFRQSCQENSIDCSDIYFRVINKHNKRQITVAADEQHPAPSYNLYGYTFDSGAIHYTIRYFANAQALYGMLQKSHSYVINEDVIKTSE